MTEQNRRADDKRAPGKLQWGEGVDSTATKLTDDDITVIWQTMPGGPAGWLKSFGFLQFARAVEEEVAGRCRAQGGDTSDNIRPPSAPSAASIEGLTKHTRSDGNWNLEEFYLAADVERLLATQSAKQGAQPSGMWHPIETAPKDGSEVLLYLRKPYSRVALARWFGTWENWQEGELPNAERDEYGGIGSACPSHWRPLPAAPGAVTQAAPEQAAQVQADVRDAERYRYLRGHDASLETQQHDTGIVNGPSCYHEVEGIRELKWGVDLDSAIDAAMTSKRAASTDGEGADHE